MASKLRSEVSDVQRGRAATQPEISDVQEEATMADESYYLAVEAQLEPTEPRASRTPHWSRHNVREMMVPHTGELIQLPPDYVEEYTGSGYNYLLLLVRQAEEQLNLPYHLTRQGLIRAGRDLLLRTKGPQGGRHTEEDELLKLGMEASKLLDAPALDLWELGDLESAPSGGGSAPVPFPALRVSTVSSAIYPNYPQLEAWRRQFSGLLPQYVTFELNLRRQLVVLTLHQEPTRGAYKLTLGSYGKRASGFGPSIGFGQPLAKLTKFLMEQAGYRGYQRGMGHDPKSHDEYRQDAQDLIFGRRRSYQLPDGRWAIKLTDPQI